MSVRWTQPALGDIAGVFAYIARDNEEAAVRVVDELMAAGAGLALHPRMGRPGRVRGTRELVVGRYVLVYRMRDELIIVRVIRGATREQALARIQKRLRRYIPESRVLSEELIEERRAEVERKNRQ